VSSIRSGKASGLLCPHVAAGRGARDGTSTLRALFTVAFTVHEVQALKRPHLNPAGLVTVFLTQQLGGDSVTSHC
jgi:hypothetical protein